MMSGAWTVDWSVLGGWGLVTGMRGVLLLVAVGASALLLARASAARRHLVWSLGMIGLLVLPLAQLGVPRWSVELPGSGWIGTGGAEVEAGSPAAVGAPRGIGGVTGLPATSRGALVADRASATSGEPAAVPGTAVPVVPGGVPDGSGAADRAGAGSRPGVAEGGVTPVHAAGTEGPAGTAQVGALLLGVWGLGVLVLMGAVLASHGALRRLEDLASPFPGERVARELSHLAVVMGVGRPVRLLQGGEGQMPMSWGLFRPVILLPRGAERWPASRLRAVLLHELAHVQRRDCLTQMVAELARALHWPNPLAWVAVWRLRVEREHACDDRVLAAGARASAYADELLSLARGFRTGRRGSLAAVAMARSSNLESRLTAVLAEGRKRRLSRRGAAVSAGVALLLTVAVAGLSATPGAASPVAPESVPEPPPALVASGGAHAEPGTVGTGAAHGPVGGPTDAAPQADDPAPMPARSLQAVSCGTEATDWESSSHRRNNERTRVTWSRPGCEVDVLLAGEVEFNSTFDDVERLGPGARFRLEEIDGSAERRLEITPGAGGAPVHEYRVEGEDRPFDTEARAWYEALLLQLFRRAGLLAEERVAAFLEAGGLPAVLQEMELLQADHVYARYVEETIRQADLSQAQLEDLLDRSADRVDSDHYLAEILEAVAERTELNDRMLDTFISASRSLGSDHYRAEVLETALERGDLSDAQVRALLESASEIGSDHYQAEILEGVADRYALRAELRTYYLQAVEGIGSDHYATEVLSGLLERSDLDEEEKATILRAASRIDSDHYVTEILEGLVEAGLGTGPLRDTFFDVVESIDSDHYRQQALRAMLDAGDELSQDQLRRVVEAAGVIDSDHYRSELLVEIARGHRLGGAVRDAYLRVMDSIGSQHYRGRVAEALLRQGGSGG